MEETAHLKERGNFAIGNCDRDGEGHGRGVRENLCRRVKKRKETCGRYQLP